MGINDLWIIRVKKDAVQGLGRSSTTFCPGLAAVVAQCDTTGRQGNSHELWLGRVHDEITGVVGYVR